MPVQTFEKRRVGTTELEVTTLGLGGATLAGIFQAVPEEQARATVRSALEAGIGYYDTAPFYGFGRSEHFMGDALRGHLDGKVLSTKVGRVLHPVPDGNYQRPHNWVDHFAFEDVFDYSYWGIMKSWEHSLQRLGVPHVDILYVHDIGVTTHGEETNRAHWQQLTESGYRALTELKAKGEISAIGLGVNEWEILMDAFELGDWDVFLLAGRYTLLEQPPIDPFLNKCVERKSSIVVGGPFNGGALMGTGMWNYAKAPEAVTARVAQLEALCKEFDVPIGAAALQFPLAHPAICNILPGPKSPAELNGILAWWGTEIPAEFWTALAERKLVAPGIPLPGGGAAR